MFSTLLQKIPLALASLTALAIGGFILLSPTAFYALYALTLPDTPSLFSDLRATAAGLTVAGAFLAAGVLRRDLTRIAAGFGAALFLAYAAGRGLSLMLDGAPHPGMIEAAVIELVLGAFCALSWWQASVPRAALRPAL